jgi:polyisoprenoid-binding protein YceI
MKTIARSILVFAASFALTGMMRAETIYDIDPAHSSAEFSVRHMMLSNVRGEFNKITGVVHYDPTDLSHSNVNASIDVTTLNTREPDRDKHLKSPDFFDVAKYPVMTFQSKEFVKNGDKVQMKGDLTLHGVTKSVVFNIDGPTPEAKDPWGKLRRGASATAMINRKDFGLVWNKDLDGGGVLVGDDVQVTLDLEAVRR